mgnify:CR=1 FL=1
MNEMLSIIDYVPRGDWTVFSVVLGLFIGSFLNVVSDRYMSGESIVWPPSHCTACGRRLRVWELIPVVSWLCLRGRCFGCRTVIGIRYPLAELLTGAAMGLVGWTFGPTAACFWAWVVTALFFVMSLIDAQTTILPDRFTLGGAVIALPVSILVFGNGWIGVLAGGVLGAGVFWLVGMFHLRRRGVEGLGFGDVKLMLMIGFLVTAELLPLVVILAGLAALMGFGAAALARRTVAGLGEIEMPFGPYLCLAAWVSLLWGRDLWQWWLNLVLSF